MNAIPRGGDGTLSVTVPSGRVAWIYADTVYPNGWILHSTVIMQDRGCFVPLTGQLLPDDADGTFWWPEAASGLPDGRVLIVAGDGYFGQRLRGAIAVERAGALVFDHWLTYWPQPFAGVSYSAGLLLDGSTLRVYGTRMFSWPWAFGKELWLASVPADRVTTPAAWQLGTAPVWGSADNGVDTAVAPYRDAAGFHLVTLSNGVYGNGPLIALDGPAADGPFTARTLLSYERPGQLRYNAAVHPEAQVDGGGLLVTINNNWPWNDTNSHPVATYQPSYFTVTR